MTKLLKKRVVFVVAVVGLISLVFVLKGCLLQGNNVVSQIKRSEYGMESTTKQYQVTIGDEEKRTIEIQISPQKYTKKELRKRMEEAMNQLETVILGANTSADYVTKDLNLVTELPGYPFEIAWELSRYDVMDSKGQLIPEKIVEIDGKAEGVLVTLTGILTYEEQEAVYEREVLLFTPKKERNVYEELLQQVSETDKSSREMEYLALPDQIEGKPVTWEKMPDYTMEQLTVLGVIAYVLYLFWKRDQVKQRAKKRHEEMLMDYPEIIGQLTMLMEAGMTSKATWKKITDDYKAQKNRTGRVRPAYEEMLYTWQEMQSGVPEAECYERFADRCELSPYMKMGALLSQNLRKGTKGLSEMLSMEAIEAMEERRNRAKRLGEEAGTKLMIPMLMMLIVVMIIVIVPAFMSIQI